jgi:hypothetical protein
MDHQQYDDEEEGWENPPGEAEESEGQGDGHGRERVRRRTHGPYRADSLRRTHLQRALELESFANLVLEHVLYCVVTGHAILAYAIAQDRRFERHIQNILATIVSTSALLLNLAQTAFLELEDMMHVHNITMNELSDFDAEAFTGDDTAQAPGDNLGLGANAFAPVVEAIASLEAAANHVTLREIHLINIDIRRTQANIDAARIAGDAPLIEDEQILLAAFQIELRLTLARVQGGL